MNVPADYPLYKKIATINRDKFLEMVKMFKYEIKRHYEGKYDRKSLYIIEKWAEHEQLNNITDLFTEECRINCSFKGFITPSEFWQKNKEQLLRRTKEPRKLREILYSQTRLCNNFRISVAMSILKMYAVKSWLDISAGWGDRLIAAIACDVKYLSTDPNECLHDKYNNIISTLAPPDKKDQFIIRKNGFENLYIPINERFDLCFTSPPFFDLEDYSSSVEDSITTFNSENEWYKKFLIYSIKKAINVLKVDGHLILYIAESKGTNYINKMLEYVGKLAKYKGIIYYYYPENLVPKLRGSYVWKKKYDENPNFYLRTYKGVDIIQDNLLDGGTKQRAMISIIRKKYSSNKELIFKVDKVDFNIVTIAYSCYVLKKTIHIFVSDISKIDKDIRDQINKFKGVLQEGGDEEISIFKGDRDILEISDDLLNKVLEKKIRFTLGTTFVGGWLEKYDEVWVNPELSVVLGNIFTKSKIVEFENNGGNGNESLWDNNSIKILFWANNPDSNPLKKA